MTASITPLSDRVVATREEVKTKTVSGIYLPDSAKEKPVSAIVAAVGPVVKGLKKGDRIVYRDQYSVITELTIDGTEYLIIKEEDVLAKLG